MSLLSARSLLLVFIRQGEIIFWLQALVFLIRLNEVAKKLFVVYLAVPFLQSNPFMNEATNAFFIYTNRVFGWLVGCLWRFTHKTHVLADRLVARCKKQSVCVWICVRMSKNVNERAREHYEVRKSRKHFSIQSHTKPKHRANMLGPRIHVCGLVVSMCAIICIYIFLCFFFALRVTVSCEWSQCKSRLSLIMFIYL